MSDATADTPSRKWSPPWWLQISGVRLWSGLVLFVYVATHLFNHMLGLWSLDAMDAWQMTTRFIWRSWPGTVLLYGSLAGHVAASLISVFRRRTLQLRAGEWWQLALGLAIPLLLLTHVMGTRYATAFYGIRDNYAYVLISTFVFDTASGWMNAAGLIAAWAHGCLGLYFWARLKPWFTRNMLDAGLVLATLWPLLALGGYLAAGREVIPLAMDGEYMGAYYERLRFPTDEAWGRLIGEITTTRYAFIALLVALVAAKLASVQIAKRRAGVTVTYMDGPQVEQPHGPSLLEISRAGGVPHASVCGGRGRCSTCRVRILEADRPLPAADEAERRVLARIHAGDDVRLACQLRPQGRLRVLRLLPSDATVRQSGRQEDWASGRESTVTVMFADLRDFTSTSEKRLPFDVVYLVNQFSGAMGRAVEAEGGRIDKFLGDGFMAIFGMDDHADDPLGAARAIKAAAAMLAALDDLNARLESDLDAPLRIGIGLHTGPVILGDMGYGTSRGLTAIGDVVNTASRLEAATKQMGCTVCLSKATAEASHLSFADDTMRETPIRGRDELITLHALDRDDLQGRTSLDDAPDFTQVPTAPDAAVQSAQDSST